MYIAGIDIGGTSCGINLAQIKENKMEFWGQEKFSTPSGPETSLKKFKKSLQLLLQKNKVKNITAIGVSCGGPLDTEQGLIQSPPNLPGWDDIDIISPLQNEFNTDVSLQNDANAGALAEWYFGAGVGASNLIFLTFGTGMGAGLILNNSLYSGTNDLAGEVGHIRLAEEGPLGYGKKGSFEGFCSGGGIARLARSKARSALKSGNPPSFCTDRNELEEITAEKVGKAAQNGDPLALEIYKISGKKLGKGLSILIDILNPEKIIIGSIYVHQQELLEPIVKENLKKEALSGSLSVCEIVPAQLGEKIGDYASLSVALEYLNENNKISEIPQV